jgi:dTDP-4-amino-4,6-dideoxygalactose transaminase
MDGIQGAVLRIKLKHLDSANGRRRAHAAIYDKLLSGTEQVITPAEAAHNRHVYHIYAVRLKERDQVLQSMTAQGISCAIHYPIPVHLQHAYGFLGCAKGSFPVAERCAEEFLSLPMYPELSSDQVQFVAETLNHSVPSLDADACAA